MIQSNLSLLKKKDDKSKIVYNLQIETSKTKSIVSNNAKGDPLKFEIIIKTNYKILKNDKLLLTKQIEKNNIYNNDDDMFKLQQNEEIIFENISEKISETIISSIINLDDN